MLARMPPCGCQRVENGRWGQGLQRPLFFARARSFWQRSRIAPDEEERTMKTFTIAIALLMAAAVVEAQQYTGANGANGTLVTCESKNNVRHTCAADARGRLVTVNQELSKNPCVAGKTWGVTRNRKGIWVDDGCRAEFLVG